MKPVKLELLIDDKTLKGILSAEGNLDRLKKYTEGSIKILESELRALQKEYKAALDAGTTNKAKEAEIQALTGKIAELREGLEHLSQVQDKVAGKPLVDGGAAPKMRNLHNSMAQIARELPSLAVGPQMFFLAISNNIPILQDAISSARVEYERMTAAGEKAIPVWRQVVKGIVSWQTALAVGVTLQVMYGDEIADWVTSLSKGKDAALSLADATDKVSESLKEDSKDFAEQVTLVKSLAERWKALGGDMAAQKKFIKDNRDELDGLETTVENVSQAENLFVKNTDAYIASMEQRAKAAAAFNLAVEQQEKAYEAQIKREQEERNGPSGWDKVLAFGYSAAKTMGSGTYKEVSAEEVNTMQIKALHKEQVEAENLAEKYRELANEATKAAQALFNGAGFKKDGNDKGTKNKDFATILAEARVEAERKAERARIAVMQEGVEKRKALAAQERRDELERIAKQEREQLELLAKAKKAGQKVSGTEENEIKEVAAEGRVATEAMYLKKIAEIEKEWQDAGIQAWIEYNKQYGTAQEKRLAITQDYTRRIAAAQHEGEKASLQAAMKEELQEVNMQELTNSIDFADVFGRLDQQTTAALKALRDKLREYVQTKQGELNATDQKTLQDALNRIERTIGERRPATTLKEGYNELVEAQREVVEAQKNVETAQQNGEVVVQEYSQETGELTTEVMTLAQAEEKLEKAQNKRQKAMSKLTKGAEDFAKKMRQTSNAANSIVGSLESLGVDVGSDMANVIEGFGQATEGAEEFAAALASGNVMGAVAGGLKTLAGTVKMVGSAFGVDWGGEKSRAEYEKAKEKYEAYMDVLDRVIDKQKELVASMEADDYKNAQNSYEQAIKLLRNKEEYARQMGKNYLNSGASSGFWGIGSSSSHGVDQSEGISSEAWQQLKDVMGPRVWFKLLADGRMTSLFDMSVEQLIKLRDEATGFYSELHEETRNYIEDIIAAGDAVAEVENARREGLTKHSFDDFKNSYINMMLDLESTNEDFAKNFEKQLQKAVLEGLFNTKYKAEIEQLYKDWADMAESGGELTPEEARLLQERRDLLSQAIVADREAAEKAFGWDSDAKQSGRAGSAISITEETAGRLEGIGNATLDHVATIDDTAFEIRDSLAGAAGSLATIAENSEYLKRLDDIANGIESMNFSGVKIKN